MIRFFVALLLMCTILLCNSCGGDAGISGTGHGGEAVIIGTALAGDGSPAADIEITLAPESFSALENDDNELYRVKTDREGNFTIVVKESGGFTLSGQDDSLFLYRDQIQVELDSETPLGDINFTKGREFTVVPWWENSAENYISVTGTPWAFLLNDSANMVTLPEEKLSFVRYEDTAPYDSITLDLKETKVIGKDNLTNTGLLHVPSRVKMGEEFELTIEPFTDGDRYLIDWGDKTKESCNDGDLVHTYSKSGLFFIMLYKESDSGVFSKIPVDLSEIIVTDNKTD